jgi:hypothetical protein
MAIKILGQSFLSAGTAYLAATYFSLSKPKERAVVVGIYTLICKVAEVFYCDLVKYDPNGQGSKRKLAQVQVLYFPTAIGVLPFAIWVGKQFKYPGLDPIHLAGLSAIGHMAGQTTKSVYNLLFT